MIKKVFLLLVAVLTVNTLFAQEPPKDKDKSESPITKTKEKVAQTGSRDRLVFDFGYDNWVRNVPGLSTKRFGFSFDFYFFYDILLGKSRFSFAPGIGFATSTVSTNEQLIKRGDSTTIPMPATNIPNYDAGKTNFAPLSSNTKKYALNTVYVDIPLELRYRSKPNKRNKSVKVAAGFKAGILIDDHTRAIETGPDGNRQVVKIKHYSDLSLFRYGPSLRIGYGPFSVFGYYGVGDLFKGTGPQSIHPYTVGISINGL